MRQVQYIYFTALLAMLFISSCNDSDDGTPTPTRTDLLVQNWQLESVTLNGDNIAFTGYSFRFQRSGVFAIQVPNASDIEIPLNGNWNFNTDESEVILSNTSNRLTILSLTSDSMILEYQFEDIKLGEQVYVFTFRLA